MTTIALNSRKISQRTAFAFLGLATAITVAPVLFIIIYTIVNLAGVPSIVFGLFGLSVFVLAFHFGLSLLAASLTLAAQALAMVITTSREAILAVPREFREGSLAIGVTKWQTVRHIVLPQALPGIITGAVLAISRAAAQRR